MQPHRSPPRSSSEESEGGVARVPGEGDDVTDVLDARGEHDQPLETEPKARVLDSAVPPGELIATNHEKGTHTLLPVTVNGRQFSTPLRQWTADDCKGRDGMFLSAISDKNIALCFSSCAWRATRHDLHMRGASHARFVY